MGKPQRRFGKEFAAGSRSVGLRVSGRTAKGDRPGDLGVGLSTAAALARQAP